MWTLSYNTWNVMMYATRNLFSTLNSPHFHVMSVGSCSLLFQMAVGDVRSPEKDVPLKFNQINTHLPGPILSKEQDYRSPTKLTTWGIAPCPLFFFKFKTNSYTFISRTVRAEHAGCPLTGFWLQWFSLLSPLQNLHNILERDDSVLSGQKRED